MKNLILIFTGVLMLINSSCTNNPKPIEYGHQACEYCRMSIVDDRYAAQLFSNKGKTYSFDALECLINFKKENNTEWKQELVTDYNNPRQLISAHDAIIVRTAELPSPMGMYLTAVQDKAAAEELTKLNGGDIYTYPELERDFNKLPEL